MYDFFIFLPFSVCLIWCATLGMNLKRNGRPGLLLLFFALVCSCLYLCHAIHFSMTQTGTVQWAEWLYLGCNLAVYPLFYLYIKSLTSKEVIGSWTPALFLPAFGILVAGAFTVRSESAFGIVRKVTAAMFILEVAYVAVSGFRRLNSYRKSVENFYADTEDRLLSPTVALLALFVMTSVASAVANLVGRDAFRGSMLIAIPSMVFSTLLYFVFYFGDQCKYSYRDFEKDLEAEPRHAENQPVTPEDVLFSRICSLMEEKKIYLRSGLKITDLAAEAGTNRTYASKAINVKTGKSFSEFVTQYRINHALELLKNQGAGAMKLSEIASASGFLSGNSFYKAFTKSMGMPPSEWVARNRAEN